MNENEEQNIIQPETPVVVPTEEEVKPIAVVTNVEEPAEVAPTIEETPVETPTVVIPEVPVVEEPTIPVETAPVGEIDLAPVGEITTTVDAIENKVEEPTPLVEVQPVVEVPAIETPVVEAPVLEESVLPTIEEAISTQTEVPPVEEVPSTPVIEEAPVTPVVESPVVETPAVETPTVEVNTAGSPVVEQTANETPAVEAQEPIEEPISAEGTVNNTPAPAGGNKGILIVAIVLILAAIGVAVYFLFLKVDEPAPEEPQNTPVVIDVTEEDAVLNYCVSLNTNNEPISYTEVIPEGCSEVAPSVVVDATTKEPVNKWACCPKIEETPETPIEGEEEKTEEPTTDENTSPEVTENQTAVVE